MNDSTQLAEEAWDRANEIFYFHRDDDAEGARRCAIAIIKATIEKAVKPWRETLEQRIGESDAKLIQSRAAQAGEPDAKQLAVTFHNIYERLAPDFGYETRKETREFDPTTPNGRLMVAVCEEILKYHLSRAAQASVWQEWTGETVRQFWRDNQKLELKDDEQWNTFFQSVADAHNATLRGAGRDVFLGHRDKLSAIIQAAIEKATEELCGQIETWKRNFDLAMEKIYALENPSRAAQAGEEDGYREFGFKHEPQ